MSEWQPIETAPKGERVLVATERGFVSIALFDPILSAWDFEDGGDDEPTHWAHLPTWPTAEPIITPEMIRAGASTIEVYRDLSDPEELAERVFETMNSARAALPHP